MTALPAISSMDQARWIRLADWLAVGVAVSLPWSTSATGILIVLWLVAVLPTMDAGMLRREIATAAGGLPVLLWVLAAVGTLWADVSWGERFGGLGGFNRLLVIPLLLAHFRRSERGALALYGYFFSVLGLLIVSWGLAAIPGLPWRGKEFGVPVKDYIVQGESFLICAFALIGRAIDDARARRWRSAEWLVALAVALLANIFFVATGRTALLVAPVLALLLGWRQFGWRGMLGAGLATCVVGGAVWYGSPYLRARMNTSVTELQAYRLRDAYSSTALHLEFLKKSMSIVETAAIIGHGTGSIPEQFRNVAFGQTGAAATESDNPHNQVFTVAIQLGLVGAAVLVAMWVAHFTLFRGGGFTSWIGAIIVTQSIVASLVNSNLFDFSEGWLYVFGVGVAGGMILRARDSAAAAAKS